MNEPNPSPPSAPGPQRRIAACVEGRRVRVNVNLAERLDLDEARLLQDELSAAILTALLRQTLDNDNYPGGSR
jgi:hypothetical protein